jgi:heme exporter protein C
VPIVHFSVYWWRTLHPSGPAPLPGQDTGLGVPELATFFVALFTFTLLYVWLLTKRVELGRLADQVQAAELADSRSSRIPVSA